MERVWSEVWNTKGEKQRIRQEEAVQTTVKKEKDHSQRAWRWGDDIHQYFQLSDVSQVFDGYKKVKLGLRPRWNHRWWRKRSYKQKMQYMVHRDCRAEEFVNAVVRNSTSRGSLWSKGTKCGAFLGPVLVWNLHPMYWPAITLQLFCIKGASGKRRFIFSFPNYLFFPYQIIH